MFVFMFFLYLTKNSCFSKCEKICDWVMSLIYPYHSVKGTLAVRLRCPVNPMSRFAFLPHLAAPSFKGQLSCFP
jgi:hypothetical protein